MEAAKGAVWSTSVQTFNTAAPSDRDASASAYIVTTSSSEWIVATSVCANTASVWDISASAWAAIVTVKDVVASAWAVTVTVRAANPLRGMLQPLRMLSQLLCGLL